MAPHTRDKEGSAKNGTHVSWNMSTLLCQPPTGLNRTSRDGHVCFALLSLPVGQQQRVYTNLLWFGLGIQPHVLRTEITSPGAAEKTTMADRHVDVDDRLVAQVRAAAYGLPTPVEGMALYGDFYLVGH